MPNKLGLLGDPRGEMRATPRNKLMGLLADALGSANSFATQMDPRYADKRQNQTLGLLADAVSLGSLAKTADRISYGEPLTNAGKANVPYMKPETADALMMAPLSPRNALAALGMVGGMADTGVSKAIFAGIGAKTADKAALAKAQQLTTAGADPKAVWRDTGWFKGGDGRWRFEIDDSAARLRDYNYTPQEAYKEARTQAFIDGAPSDAVKAMAPYAGMSKAQLKDEYKRTGGRIVDAAMAGDKAGAMQMAQDRGGLDAIFGAMRNRSYGPASSFMAHGELGAAYPDVYKLHTRIAGDLGGGTKGQYLRGDHTQGEQIALAGKPTFSENKSTMLHELQHAVQQREGFAAGGSPEMFDPKNAEMARDILSWRKEVERFMQDKGINPKTNADAWMNAQNGLIQEYSQIGALDMLPSSDVRHEAMQFRFKAGQPERAQIEKLVQEYGLDKQVSPRKPMDMYRSLAGEAEARAVQSRMNMNPQQRREVFPLDSYDVPINSLIYR